MSIRTILLLAAIGLLCHFVVAQTTIQKPSNTAKLQKHLNYGVSNMLYLRPAAFSSAAQKLTEGAFKERLGIANISQFLLSYYVGSSSSDQVYGLRYHYLWRTGKGVYLGTGLGFYYGSSKSTTTGSGYNTGGGLYTYPVSEKDTGLAVYVPLTARFRLGSPLYFEVFGGPELHQTKNQLTTNGYSTEESSTKFEAMAGANFGYRFGIGVDISLRYNSIVGLGFGIAYGPHEHR